MKTILLKDFIKTGHFGSITIGSDKKHVTELLGNNYDFGDCGESQIIKYGWYEFFYWTATGKIFGIQNDHLQADCINHHDMINYENSLVAIDKWFLKEHKNSTFGQVTNLLKEGGIAFTIEPAYNGCEENIIRCTASKVTFDFAGEYNLAQLDENGEMEHIEIIETREENYVLNGIRLFEY